MNLKHRSILQLNQRLFSLKLYEKYYLRTIREIEPVKHVTIQTNENKITKLVQG